MSHTVKHRSSPHKTHDGHPGFRESATPEIRRNLLSWYGRNQRVLPWRESPSLYGTIVSEFMLQQTQVKTMLPYYERWMQRFPGPESLADSAESEVMRLWQGLGYYRHATFRQRSANFFRFDSTPDSRGVGILSRNRTLHGGSNCKHMLRRRDGCSGWERYPCDQPIGRHT